MLRLTVEPRAERARPAGATVAVWRDDRGAIFARARADGQQRWIEWPDVGVFTFSVRSTDVRVCPAPGADWDRVRDLFARVLQPVVLQALGRQALHASAVLGAGGVVAFCGRGHSGKSTLAFALGSRGFRQIADDALVIDAVAPIVAVRPLPFIPQLREASRRHFDDHPAAPLPDDERLLLPETAPLRAVVLLEQDPELSRSAGPQRLPAVQAFAALLRHAHCFHESDRAHSTQLVEDYLKVAESVAVFGFRYRPGFAEFPRLVDQVVDLAGRAGVTADLPPVALDAR